MISDYFIKYRDIFEDETLPCRHLIFENTDYFVFIRNDKGKYLKSEPDIFWHISSIGEEEFGEVASNSDVLLCMNTPFVQMCGGDCKNPSNRLSDKRIPCCFRADSIKFFSQLIEFQNNNDPNCYSWIYNKRLFVRKIIDNKDFVAIFDFGKKDYKGKKTLILITFYPIVLYSLRKKFDKRYNEYICK